MSEIIVGTKLPPFSWLPNYIVNDPRFTDEVLAVSLYLNGKPEGWVPRAEDIKKRFGYGKEKWERISKVMRELGLLHEKQTQKGKQLVFEIRCEITPQPSKDGASIETEIPQGRKTRRCATAGNRTVGFSADIVKKKANTNKDFIKDHKDHDHNDFKKEPKNKKPTMKQREANLSTDEFYIYQKLVGFKGIFAGVAMAIVEQNSVGDINYLIEAAIREGIKNPGAYVVSSIYKKEA